MRRQKNQPDSTLRQQAEKVVYKFEGGAQSAHPFDLVSALEELRVYGAELEIQNEELVQSRAEAENAQKKYFQHFDLAPVAMIRLDRAGVIREANLLAAAMLSVPRSTIHASPIYFAARLRGESNQTFHRHLKIAFTSLKPEACELSVRNAAGGETYVRLQSIASRGENDWADLFVTLTDLTDHKRAEAERSALERTLLQRQKLENIGTLAGGIAHDFNNILQVIISRLSMAESLATSDPLLLEHIEGACRAATRATGLSRRLLTFSKGGSPTRQALDVEEMLRSSVDFVLSGSPLKAEFLFEAALRPVLVDPVQFGQVIENVVINAREATPGEGTVFIRARNGRRGPASDKNGWVIIEIEDQGTGIPAAVQDRIFEVCFTTKPGNSGIGLATTKSIMEQHGGSVAIRSQVDHGTTVTLFLPATNQELLLRAVPPAPEIQKRLGRILLIDDEKMILEVVPLMLKGLGYECAVAECGIEGCEVYLRAKQERRPFAAVLLDGTIPGGVGGKGALKLLQKADPEARVVLCSGYANSDLFLRAEELGFKGRLAKPFTVPELVATLNQVLA
ncbi:MAG TPA: ATP-binding protein [Chthoniobacterales bacterium]